MSQEPKVLLLENIHELAAQIFKQAGFIVETVHSALSEDELIEKLKGVQVLGIRSKTQVTHKVLSQASSLQALGCFCIGTNQVDLKTARERGVPVFNAPFSNTRSVAEMVIAEMIMLARELGTRNNEMHAGIWNKRSEGCFEVRGKTLGIIGYGNIGTQVSTLAESLGMKVIFYDVVSKLSLGNAKPVATLQDLLKKSDFVTLHVPMTESTQGMIGANELALMKEGAYLLNASRGTVVQMEPLVARLKSGYLSGAALDVFPVEPEKTKGEFKTELAGLNNVIMTPHIGGATEEAQGNIGREVSSTLVKFYETGSTFMSVNMPQVDVPKASSKMVGSRFTNIHKNVPGVLRELNRIVSECGANILSQHLATDPQLGYLIMDLDQPLTDQMLVEIQKVSASIQSRRI